TMLGYIVNQQGTEVPLESKMFSRFVENAQKKIEGNNFDARKTLLEYDEVLRKHREIIYEQRRQILFYEDITDIILKMMRNTGERLVWGAILDGKKIDGSRFYKDVNGIYFPLDYVKEEEFDGLSFDEGVELFMQKCQALLEEKRKQFPREVYLEFLKVVLLRVVDTYWTEHIDTMSELRQAVRLQAYAQVNPLREYQEIGYQKFEAMIQAIENDATRFINRAMIRDNLQREQVIKPVATHSGKEEDLKRKPVVRKDKVGRNDPCPCGSGKKYKHCCGR
ncbi:MAG TPA: preprotein translocase subunit SecA, partial [Acholeplasmataceae bacterium]|nr:preprotein translocase subunit SecA [Acholeplasmataceae bacterium]